MGVVGLLPAASVACSSIGGELLISRPAQEGDGAGSGELHDGALNTDRAQSSFSTADGLERPQQQQALRLCLAADVDVHSLVTSACPGALWPLPAAAAELDRALRAARVGRAAGQAPGALLLVPSASADDLTAASSPASVAQSPSAASAMVQQQQQQAAPAAEQPQAQPANLDAGLQAQQPSGAQQAAGADHAAHAERERQERSASGAQASTSSAAEAARAAWAAAQPGSSPFSRAPAPTASSGINRRASLERRALRLPSPRASLGSAASAERGSLLHSSRRSTDPSQDHIDEEGGDALGAALHTDRQRGAPALLLDWRVCVRIDADSRLQSVSAADGSPEIVIRYERCLLTGKSISPLRLGSGGRACPTAAASASLGNTRRQGSGEAQRHQEPCLRPGLFTAEFNVQASRSCSLSLSLDCSLHRCR